MRVILQPCSSPDAQKHFADTIQNPVELSRHSDITELETPHIRSLFTTGKASIWGVTPGKNNQNISKWKLAAAGDVVLFSGAGRIFATGILAAKIHSPILAQRLWGQDKEGLTWEYIYLLDEVRPTGIPYRDFNHVVGHKPNFVIPGFMVLSPEKSEKVIDSFGLASVVHEPEVSREDYDKALNDLDKINEFDRKVAGSQRVEQTYLRKALFKGASSASCAICGRKLPTTLLRAAHIKFRSVCTATEKRDAKNIVMPLCILGCDGLYESGYLGINNVGDVEIANKWQITPSLQEILQSLVGKKCASFSGNSRKYFDWHYQTRFLPRKGQIT
jgi:hypothetical protein